MVERKGYSKAKDIPRGLLSKLSKGEVESKTLVEITAIDMTTLLGNNIPNLKKNDLSYFSGKAGILKKMKEAASMVSEAHGYAFHKELMANNKSDTLRGIGSFMVGQNNALTAKQKVKAIMPYAKDHHFGVREWAWMAIRDEIVSDFDSYYEQIVLLSTNRNEYIRRFSVESVRPRGVWAAHIAVLKTDPSVAEELIESVFFDSSKYVNDSVGNWLNDAAKDNPKWVSKKCSEAIKRADKEFLTTAQYVVAKATRSINKK